MFKNYIRVKYLILLGNDYYKTLMKWSLKDLKVVINFYFKTWKWIVA